MAYIVPKEQPNSCHDCPFHYCSEYHPFWSGDKEKRNTQTIRCQAIEPFRSTILDINDKTFKADWCPLVDAADVAPKSGVDNLEYTLMGVMHSVDKWLEGDELKQDEVNRAITMREKTLRIIENAKTEVAREIFEEIEEIAIEHEMFGRIVLMIGQGTLAKLKKKYTGEQT